jgi:hypothetical protein
MAEWRSLDPGQTSCKQNRDSQNLGICAWLEQTIAQRVRLSRISKNPRELTGAVNPLNREHFLNEERSHRELANTRQTAKLLGLFAEKAAVFPLLTW